MELNDAGVFHYTETASVPGKNPQSRNQKGADVQKLPP